MKEYFISIIFVLDKAMSNKKECAEFFGLSYSDLKKKKWAPGRQPEQEQYWLIDSNVKQNAPIEDHLDKLSIKIRDLRNKRYLKKVYLDIGVFYSQKDIPLCKVNFPLNKLEKIKKKLPSIILEISFYPS